MFVLLFLFCKAYFPLKLLSCFWNLCFQPFDSFNRPFQVLFHPSSLCPPSPPPPSPPLPLPCWDVTEQKMCMSCSVMDVFFHTGRSVQLFRAHRVRVTPLTMTAWGRCGCCILLCHLIVVFCVHACTCSHRFLLSVKPLSKRQMLKVGCWGVFFGSFFLPIPDNTKTQKQTLFLVIFEHQKTTALRSDRRPSLALILVLLLWSDDAGTQSRAPNARQLPVRGSSRN